jgi:hypothetical protein
MYMCTKVQGLKREIVQLKHKISDRQMKVSTTVQTI